MNDRHLTNTTESEIEAVIKVTKRIAEIGLDAGVGGNISIRLSNGSGILITASGASVLDDPTLSFMEIGFDGQPLNSTLKPSKDLPVHLGIYNKCPTINAIIHTHSPVATAYSINNKEIPLLTVVSKKMIRLPILDTDEMRRTDQGKFIGEYINNSHISGIIMKNHGIVSTGSSLQNAQKTAELIELTARIALCAKSLEVN